MKKITLFLACLAAFAMVFGFTVTAAMADADLYGSIRFRTYWVDKDKNYSGTGFDDEDLDWRIGYLSRWGVNYKSGDIKGKMELDTRDQDGDEGSSEIGDIRVRHLYGEWDFGSGKLLIGQTFNPCTVYASGLGYFSGGLQKFHSTGLKYFRTSQIRLTFDKLMIAFLTPDTEQDYAQADIDTTFPRIEARYSFNFDPIKLDVMGGYQTYDVVDALDHEESIDSYFVGLYAQANLGAAYVKGLLNYRQNGGNYGLWSVVNERAQWNGNDFDDCEAFGYSAVVGYKFSDKVTVEASVAGSSAENTDMAGDPEDDAVAYSFHVKYSPAPGVIIQPEFIYDDRQESDFIGPDDDQGDAYIFGVFWMINFK
ncbi:MAG: hypothetical protein SRB2_01696 [Desulfobacteraceae bacterium Eth-SRB2]|nr:MAG: hypothetical protein SRB2_01696 [Desulfobacteraceae bacterium Eth-SRB2]